MLIAIIIISLFLVFFCGLFLYYYYFCKNMMYSFDLTIQFYKWLFIILKSYFFNFFNVLVHHIVLFGLVFVDVGIFNLYRYYIFSIIIVFYILAPYDITVIAWNNTVYYGDEHN